jgi:putative transposase
LSNKIQLVERHVISKNNRHFAEIDKLCFLSKNLYNTANYIRRQELFFKQTVSNYVDLQKHLQNTKSTDYYALPTHVSQQVLKTLDKNWKSYFQATREYKKNPSKFLAEPKIPKYKDRIKGRNLIIFTNQRLSKKYYKKTGKLHLLGSNVIVESQILKDKINQVRIVSKNSRYVIEVVYTEILERKESKRSKRISSIDIGVNNLSALTSNVELKPTLYSGQALKSINQYYNKRVAKLQSALPMNIRTSHRIKSLTHKRDNKVSDCLHKISRMIMNQLVSHNIDTLVVGKNNNWKQDISIGKVNNQNFVMIPHAKFIKMLEYKCKLEGIKFLTVNESYTSKTSFLDKENPVKHKAYKGKRIKRGLFRSKNGTYINADINGSFQILKKAFPKIFTKIEGIEAFVVSPVKVKIYKQSS